MKLLIVCLVVISNFAANAQTVLASFPLELQNPQSKHNALMAVHPESQNLYVFASDKSRMYATKFNSAIFLRDSISTNRPDTDVDFIAGYSFNTDGEPTVYWASENFKKIRAVNLNFSDRSITTALHNISFEDEQFVGSFSENDGFYMMSVLKDNQLRFYEFRSGVISQKTIAMPALAPTGNFIKQNLHSLFENDPPLRIETKSVNPLYYSAEKVKYYIEGNRMILTTDQNTNETQLFEINLDDYSVTTSQIAQPTLQSGPGKSNSFYHQNVLYQIKVNEKELALTMTDAKTATLINTLSATRDGEIAFKDSPLLSQTANQPVKVFKDSKRFLRALYGTTPAISAYTTPDATLLTIGGVSYVASTGNIMLGVTAGVGMVLIGSDMYFDELIGNDNLRTVFFESHIDGNYNYVKRDHDFLAADKISEFLDRNNKISLFSVIPFGGYFVAGYFSKSDDKFYLRKFTDNED